MWDWLGARRGATTGRVDLALRRGRSIAAYVLGRREIRLDAYVFEEFAFSDEAAREAIAPLMRLAAGDLRKVAGWLPPDVARDALPRGAVKRPARRDRDDRTALTDGARPLAALAGRRF